MIHFPNHVGWGTNGYVEHFYLCTRETTLWTYSTFVAIVGILLPIAISFFSYLNIYILVRTSRSARNRIINSRSSGHSDSHSAELLQPATVLSVSINGISSRCDQIQVAGKTEKHSKSAHFRNEIVVAQTLLRSFALFLVSWLPLAILLMVPMAVVPVWVYLAALILAHGSTATNSIMFYVSNQQFRNGFRSFVKQCRERLGCN